MQSSEGDCQSDNNSSSYYDRPVKTDDEVDSREEKLPGTSRQTSKQDKPLKQGDQRRTELNAHTTGRNCCIEWDFRRTLHRVYAGYKQAVNRIEREQEDVAIRMHRLYHDVRDMKRRSRDQKRSDLDFLIRNSTIRDRIRSIDAEHLAKGARRSWSRIQFEKLNQKIEGQIDTAKNGDMKDTGRLPPIAEGDSTGARSHPGAAEEKHVEKAYSEEVVTETNPIDQGVIIEWLDSCLPDVSFPKDEEPIFSFTATEESLGQTNAPKPNARRKRSQLASNPTSYSALLIKHRENLMAMKTEALNERPKVYVWNGDWVNRSGNQTNQRCPPGRVGARSEFLLKEISLPKPALTRYPPPTSKDFYRRKKALIEEFTNLRQLSQAMKDLFRKLEVLKDEDGSLAVFKLLMKLSSFIQEKPSGSGEQPQRKVDEDEELNSKSGGEVSADPRC